MRTGKTIGWLTVGVALLAGCFKEEAPGAQDQTISTTVQGLIAFDQIQSNLMTDSAAAGEALLDFIRMPPAAYQLVAPPFELEGMDSALARMPAPATVPDCLVQAGEPSCDTYTSSGTCEAGPIEFQGAMSRRCSDCDDPRGFCAYGWSLPRLKYTSSAFSIVLNTRGHWEGSVGQVTPSMHVSFDLTVGGTHKVGEIDACACTALTVVNSATANGKPRKLVSSSFLIRGGAGTGSGAPPSACALVEFDASGDPLVSNSCDCPGGSSACSAVTYGRPRASSCGDQYCSADETAASCPQDCSGGHPRCGDGVCDSTEHAADCPPDCSREPTSCGNGHCEIGEDAASCASDCNHS